MAAQKNKISENSAAEFALGNSDFSASLEKSFRATGLAALDEIRKDAAKKLAAAKLPTVRDEDWRFTDLRPLAAAKFTLPERADTIDKKYLADSLIPGIDGVLVFVNGFYSAELSKPPELKTGAVFCSLGEAAQRFPEKIKGRLGKISDCENEFFTALNTALFEDGAFVFIPEGTEEKTPLYIVHITGGANRAQVCSPRNLIVAEDNCSAKIIEHYISATDAPRLSNSVSEVFIGSASSVERYSLEFESAKAASISTLNLLQQRDSNSLSHSALAGGATVRSNIHPKLAGQGGDCVINGLFMPTGRQHMDNFMKVEHVAPHCDSRQLYNGVLNEKGRGVFHGRIIVHEGAAKTDAKQTNRNLLLSDTARIDTKPQLEIYNDDVKCTHGATIGQMDKDAVFYLRSRGVPENEARAVILRGFTAENLALMTVGPVRDFLEEKSERWFDDALAKRTDKKSG